MASLMLIHGGDASPEQGSVLREHREAHGWTVRQMADFTGWSEKQVRNWESGTSPAKRAIVLAYASIGNPPDELNDLLLAMAAAVDPDDDPGAEGAGSLDGTRPTSGDGTPPGTRTRNLRITAPIAAAA